MTSDNNGLIAQPEGIVPIADESVKVLRLSPEKESKDYGRMLAAAIQLFSAADILSKIQKHMEYVVQVPAQFQDALNSGALEMMHGSKSAKTWATLVRQLADGKQEIVCNCPVVEKALVQGNPIQDIAGTFQNLYMQQKLAEISKQIQEVYNVVLRIEQGQMDDRIGKLISGKHDVLLALKNPDPAARERELELARSKISEGKDQIGQIFKSRVEQFKAIPKNVWLQRLREVISFSTDYRRSCDEEYKKLQEYYEFYLKATQLLAWSYSVAGDTERAEMVFKQSMDFLRSIQYKKIQTLEYIYSDDNMEDAFYHSPISYFRAEQTACLDEAKPYELVQITVTGEKLMEVIENGR